MMREVYSFNMRNIVYVIISLGVCNVGGEPSYNEVMVLEGHEANLPCVTVPTLTPYIQNTQAGDDDDDGQDLTNSLPERPKLIVWYKDGIKSSIYSYDGRDPQNVRHWTPRRNLGGSISLTLPASPYARPQLAFLNIGYIHETDAGLYQCKVDFQMGPSKNTYTKLVVVAPPTAPTIEVWAGGRWLHTTHETSTATVEVGTKLTLRCSTSGGKPSPTVSWWRGGQQLLSSSAEKNGTISSTVNVTVVPEDAHTPIVCQATNTHLMPPLRTPLLLLVLSPPKWLRVIGAEIEMSAGTTYVVECRCVGARPPPVITWTVGGDELTDSTSTTDSEGETTSRLRFTPKPAHSGTHITCTAHPPDHAHQAASPHATPTLWVKSDSVPLKIRYKPEVELDIQVIRKQDRKSPRNENDEGDYSLESSARPPPFSPSGAVRQNQNQMFTGGVITKPGSSKSTMKDEDGKNDRKILKDVDKQDSKKPAITKRKNKVKAIVTVDEFTGAVLQCNVRANPPAYHVSWHRDDIPLSPVTSPGLMLGNMSAVFSNLRRNDAGNFTCTAHNQEGSSRSKPVLLQINHGPECARDTAKILGVPRHHTLNVTCEVDAYPPPDSFSWALRSSRGILAVPSEMIHFSGTTSWIVYTPRANVDFGDLLCWAHTPTGRQDDPCVAQLVSAEKPDTPENCQVTQRSQAKITVSCKAAHDGGLPQTFFMKVFHGGLQVANSTSVNPEISVYNLQPDTRYRLTIWSANTHGTSTGYTNIFTSTLPSNTSSTTSSMNGHSNNHRGLLSKFGSSMLAVVVVVTVVGVVVGIIVGIMVRNVGRRVHVSRREQEEDEEDEEERPPTLINNNQINVAMAGIGRRIPKCLEPLGRSTTRYDVMANPERNRDNHVYDDPITLRERGSPEGAPMEDDENIEVTHNIHYPPFSINTDYSHQTHNFSWHLPNSRLLRNKFNQRYSTNGECPRKPVRVETPRLPEFDISTTVTTKRKFQSPPGMEFRLILIPETSKMLQVALERDTRLASYLYHDSHVPNTHVKFPTITEEDEQKNVDAHDDPSVTPYESTPDDFTIENGQSDTSELLPKCCSLDTRGTIHSENKEIKRNRINNRNYIQLQEQNSTENAFDDLQITPEKIPTLTIYGRGRERHFPGSQTKRPMSYHLNGTKTTLQNFANVRASSKLQRNSFPDVTFKTDDSFRMKLALLGRQDRKPFETSKTTTPTNHVVGKTGRHHPYGMPISSVRKGIRSNQFPAGKERDKRVLQTGPCAANMIPTSPFSFLRKPKVGVTSLLSLVSSSSSTSSLSSSHANGRQRGSRETTTSPLSESRRRAVSGGAKRPAFKNLKARPRSIHLLTETEQVLHRWGEEERDNDCQSSSTPSSPRSSTSSSCFPYSSMSSSPVSSFYSSENSLSISTTFSHSSSSSSFNFSSVSGFSSSSSSPLSSFLSPSLTPTSSSVLSLSSCSPTPESFKSGHITPI